ncbi:MAG: alpha-galactosidase [Clostridiaceae bacterium]|nr:alpha-galactosidase [Clostridiaceae bacterium]
MNKLTFQDCYAEFDGRLLRIGNSVIEKQVELTGGRPQTLCLINKLSGYIWNSKSNEPCLPPACPLIDFSRAVVSAQCQISDSQGFSRPHLTAGLIFQTDGGAFFTELAVYPGHPFLSTLFSVSRATGFAAPDRSAGTNEPDIIESLPLGDAHLKFETYELWDKTDRNDQLVGHQLFTAYPGAVFTGPGQIAIVHDYLAGEHLMLIKDAPSASSSINRKDQDIRLRGNHCLDLFGSGIDFDRLPDGKVPYYGLTAGVCPDGAGAAGEAIRAAYRAYCRDVNPGFSEKRLFIMANNWGDRNQDQALSEVFVRTEIDRAAEIGVEILQIDDGWQKGAAGTALAGMNHPWEGYYALTPDFWQVHPDKFPQGLQPLAAYAQAKNVALALWFSPDSHDDFANWEKDAATLIGLYRETGIRHYKLDGIKIRSKLGEMNLIRLLTTVGREDGHRITFNLDVTADNRFGYLYQQALGTVFVENRYTDWRNYYPHNTLKNLWALAGLLPARRFQFELLNNRRNRELYGDDPLAPAAYTPDYLFAVVMMANPLFWMELSGLSGEDRACLAKIIAVYRRHSARLFTADVAPIGQCPDGASFTGFQAKENDCEGYLLLFREHTSADHYAFKLDRLADCRLDLELLATNSGRPLILNPEIGGDGAFHLAIHEERRYAFIHYKVRPGYL